MTEENRYFGSDDKPLNLAQTKGVANLELSRVRKYTEPRPIDNAVLELETETGCEMLVDKKSNNQAELLDDVTHCPINNDGKQVKAHIFQVNLNDNAYISDLYVGNPPQKVRGLFDTGSTNTWIINDKVQTQNEKQFSFKPETSSSFHNTDQRAFIQFGSGSLSGNFVTDDVRLGSCDGSKSSGQVHIKNQKFGQVLQQKTIFTGTNFESIVGLAYPALAEKGVTPVFDEMINQHLLKSNMFAFYLTNADEESKGLKADLQIGYYDKAKFTGDIHWNDIKLKYMFGVQLDDIKVNGKALNICEGGKHDCLITFDSGTSLSSVPNYAH